MATLSTLISYLPIEARSRYDFASFWIPKCNDLLDEISQVCDLPDNQKECGVEVSRNFIITPPPDYRRALSVCAYGNQDRVYPFSEKDGKIVLRDSYSKDSSQTSIVLHDWTTEKVLANIATAEDDAYAGKLLVVTNGDGDNYTHVIAESTVPGAGVLELFFDYPLAAAYSTSTAGYIATLFLMLSYVKRYTVLSASGDEISLSDRFESALQAGLMLKVAEDINDGNSSDIQYWMARWKDELLRLSGKDSEKSDDPTPAEAWLKQMRKNASK
jgi:hypothetical protein